MNLLAAACPLEADPWAICVLWLPRHTWWAPVCSLVSDLMGFPLCLTLQGSSEAPKEVKPFSEKQTGDFGKKAAGWPSACRTEAPAGSRQALMIRLKAPFCVAHQVDRAPVWHAEGFRCNSSPPSPPKGAQVVGVVKDGVLS